MDYMKIEQFKEKMNATFADVRKNKIVARQLFACCGSCGSYELGEYLEAHPRMIGAVHFSRQSKDNMEKNQRVWVNFGINEKNPTATMIEIGQKLAESARANGLFVEWDGTADQSVLLSLESQADKK